MEREWWSGFLECVHVYKRQRERMGCAKRESGSVTLTRLQRSLTV